MREIFEDDELFKDALTWMVVDGCETESSSASISAPTTTRASLSRHHDNPSYSLFNDNNNDYNHDKTIRFASKLSTVIGEEDIIDRSNISNNSIMIHNNKNSYSSNSDVGSGDGSGISISINTIMRLSQLVTMNDESRRQQLQQQDESILCESDIWDDEMQCIYNDDDASIQQSAMITEIYITLSRSCSPHQFPGKVDPHRWHYRPIMIIWALQVRRYKCLKNANAKTTKENKAMC